MNAAFADTFFCLALLDSRDPAHELAVAECESTRTIVATEFVLLELGNSCARAEDHADFLALSEGVRGSAGTRIVPLDSGLLQRRLELFAARSDKDWSVTDCISFVVMKDQRLTEALTGDRHFEQAGFKPLLA